MCAMPTYASLLSEGRCWVSVNLSVPKLSVGSILVTWSVGWPCRRLDADDQDAAVNPCRIRFIISCKY
jgi:hypothetical protein